MSGGAKLLFIHLCISDAGLRRTIGWSEAKVQEADTIIGQQK